MITIYTEEHRLHHGKFELIDGQLVPPFEKPERAEIVIGRVRDVSLGEVIRQEPHGLEPVRRVHTPDFVDFILTAHERWRAAHGDTDALPLCWPGRHLRQKLPDEIDGQLSFYSFDAGTPITAGTAQAVCAAADVALTGVDVLQRGERTAFALCRPPGHHAASDVYGGYCFFNNAAIGAQAFCDQGAERVAILDVDYHHGNGTQSIFYARPDVLFVSLHGHPKQEYPFFLGYEDETGEGEGDGYNVNFPLPWGTGWDLWSEALEGGLRIIREFRPEILVVSLGVDTFEKDPISKFRLKSENYIEIGRRIARLELPTLFVMEGGYAVDEIGINAVNVLQGFQG